MSTAQRFSLLNISLRNNTFCFWDQLVGGWPLFSPPGASIRHAEPGPEPKPGREAEPRRWHTDRQSDPLAGPGVCLSHRLLVQDTSQWWQREVLKCLLTYPTLCLSSLKGLGQTHFCSACSLSHNQRPGWHFLGMCYRWSSAGISDIPLPGFHCPYRCTTGRWSSWRSCCRHSLESCRSRWALCRRPGRLGDCLGWDRCSLWVDNSGSLPWNQPA